LSGGVAVRAGDVLRLGESHLCSLGESQWISDGSGVDGLRAPDSGGALDVEDFGLAWLGVEGEVRRPLLTAVGTAFEYAAPVREFPSYRGQRHFPGWYWAADRACRRRGVDLSTFSVEGIRSPGDRAGRVG
jgi:hypothetical protein